MYEMSELTNCPTCGRPTPDASFCQYCGKPLYSCKTCSAPVLREAIFCHECGALISGERKELMSREKVSWVWWLLPLLSPVLLTMPWVGGLISWAFNRHRNPRVASNILWLGVSLSIIIVVVGTVIRCAN